MESGTGIECNIGIRNNGSDGIPPRDSASLIEGCWISLTEVGCDMENKKVKVKTLEATTFSKMVITRVVLKLKKLGTKMM